MKKGVQRVGIAAVAFFALKGLVWLAVIGAAGTAGWW
jgi:hypothetical protein